MNRLKAKPLLDCMSAIAEKRVLGIIKNSGLLLNSGYFDGVDLAKKRYSDLKEIYSKLQGNLTLDEYDALRLLLPKHILVRDDGEAQAIYSSDDSMPNSYKIRRAGDINKYMVNGKPYYIFPEASSWRGKNHKQDFIDHIKTISKILDKNGNPLFFDINDLQSIESAFKKI